MSAGEDLTTMWCYERIELNLGASQEGDEVILSDMSAYEHARRVRSN